MNDKWKKNLRHIEPYVPGEQSKNKNIIKLNANENPYPPSPEVFQAIQSFDASELRLYPDANAAEFKKAMAKYYCTEPENIFIGNGSDDVLAICFQSFFNSGKEVVFPDITYSFYPVWCSLFNIKYKTYPLGDDFRINASDYKEPNGGVVIPNPNAPTSIGEGIEFVKEIMSYNDDSVVIIDEAYVDFGGQSSVELIHDYDNLLITGTFSKSRSLAGMRIGFAIGSKQLIAVMEAVKNSYNSYTVNSLSMAAGIASLNDEQYFTKTVNKIKATRERTAKELCSMGFTVLDSKTNFLFVTREGTDICDMFNKLKEKSIYIRYFNLPRINNYVRITVGTDDETDALISAIKHYIKQKS